MFVQKNGNVCQHYRCNSNPGCYDLSDEFDCKIINPGKSYQSFIAPPTQSDGKDDGKVVIDVSADIVSILDIDEISSIFQVSRRRIIAILSWIVFMEKILIFPAPPPKAFSRCP